MKSLDERIEEAREKWSRRREHFLYARPGAEKEGAKVDLLHATQELEKLQQEKELDLPMWRKKK